MISAYKLAGQVSAHGIWSVSDGGPLIPIHAYTLQGRGTILNRLMSEYLEEAVRIGKEELEKNSDNATLAVLIYDGMIIIEQRRWTL